MSVWISDGSTTVVLRHFWNILKQSFDIHYALENCDKFPCKHKNADVPYFEDKNMNLNDY